MADADIKFKQSIDADAPGNTGFVRFLTLADLDAWVSTEEAAWGEFRQLTTGSAWSASVLSAQTEPVRILRQAMNQAREQSAKGAEFEQNLRNFVTDSWNRYVIPTNQHPKKPQSLYSGSPVGRRALEFARAKDPASFGFLVASINHRIDVRLQDGSGSIDVNALLRGAVDAALVDIGVTSNIENERAALRSLASKWEPVLAQEQAHHTKALADIQECKDAIQVSLQKAEKGAKEQREQHAEAVKNIEATFKERMTLQAPVNYWRTKRRVHIGTAWAFALLFVALVGAGICALERYGDPVVERLLTNNEGWPTGLIILVGVPVFVGLWILRAVSRLFHTSVTYMNDAAERETMIKTYLALYDEKKLQEADRILVLQSIFRPATQTADESPPPTWFDVLVQRIKS